MSHQDKGFYQFERFRLDPSRRILLRDGDPVALPPKALATLLALLERRGEVVEKEELLQTVWPDTFISEATLTQNIFRLRKALGEGAGEHRFIVTIPGRGYSFVADAAWKEVQEEPEPVSVPARLERASRPQMPIAVPEPEPSGGPSPAPAASRRWPLIVGAGLAVLLLGVGTFLVDRLSSRPVVREPAPRGSTLRRSVAVWGFRNLTGREDSAWLATALAEMLTVELAVGERLHILSGEEVARARMYLRLEDTDDLSPGNLSKIRSILGCDALLLGSYLDLPQKEGRKIRVDLRLLDAATGETLEVTTRSSPEPELFEMVADLGEHLRSSLGAGGLPVEREGTARASFPLSHDAGRLYSEGLSALRTFDNQKARDLLSRAILAEPDFPLAHAALARAWLNLGYDERAEREAARAFELSSALSREERLLVDALRAETAKEWNRAIEIYKTLWTFFPDDLEHGLRLARAQTEAGQAKDALDTLAALRELPTLLAEDPRIDLAEADAAVALADYSRQEKLAARAAEKGEALEAWLFVARARHLQARALRSLGRSKDALERLGEASRLFAEAGDRAGVASTANDAANLRMDRGDLEGARRQHERALAIHREIGNQRGRIVALRSLGGIEFEQANFVQAKKLLNEAIAISREVNDVTGQAGGLAIVATILRSEGDLAAAKKSFEESLALYQAMGSPFGEAAGRANLAGVLQDQGDLQAARRQAEIALRLFEAAGHQRGIGYTLSRMGALFADEGRLREADQAFRRMRDVGQRAAHKSLLAEADAGLASIARLRGDLQEARKSETEALSLREQSQEKLYLVVSRLSLAQISLDQGDATAAEREARWAAEKFQAFGARDWEGLARETLTLALLAQGKAGAAEQEVREALQLTDWSQNRRARLQVLIASGRVAAELGRLAEARQTLETVRDEAVSRGLWVHRLEAELALGEIETRHGDAAAGRRMLLALHKSSSAKGFGRIAKRAGALLDRPAMVLGMADYQSTQSLSRRSRLRSR